MYFTHQHPSIVVQRLTTQWKLTKEKEKGVWDGCWTLPPFVEPPNCQNSQIQDFYISLAQKISDLEFPVSIVHHCLVSGHFWCAEIWTLTTQTWISDIYRADYGRLTQCSAHCWPCLHWPCPFCISKLAFYLSFQLFPGFTKSQKWKSEKAN